MKSHIKLKRYKNFFINLIVPAIIFGFITGTITAFFVILYKFLAKHIIELSATGYAFLRENLYFVPLVLLALFGIAFLFAFIYKKIPNIKGGGIPTSVGILRGLITFKWLRNFIGVFLLSLTSFLIGVPLGNEGPSVQMGTSIGRGTIYTFARKHKAWDRFSMTGGACAGFSVATGAPITGILFAIEEAHQRISPTIMLVSFSSVVFASVANRLFSPLFGVSERLFEELNLPQLDLGELWIPLVVGLALGIVSALLLNYFQLINKLFNKKLSKLASHYKIFIIFTLTLVFGLISFSNVSTGHDLIHSLLEGSIVPGFLVLILVVRSTLTFGANSNGITGGMFIPLLAIGATVSSLLGKGMVYLGVDEGLYTTIVIFGIVGALAGLMKTPLTAIVFSIEALSCFENIIPIIIVSLVAFFVTEVFEAKSINDTAMENRIEEFNKGKKSSVIDTFVVVKDGAFAVGKQIRDIFWPANLFVLSVKKSQAKSSEVDEHGAKALHAGDELHIQYSTFDNLETIKELEAIVGIQK